MLVLCQQSYHLPQIWHLCTKLFVFRIPTRPESLPCLWLRKKTMFTSQNVTFHKNTFPYSTIPYSDPYDQPPFPLSLESINDIPTSSSISELPNPRKNDPHPHNGNQETTFIMLSIDRNYKTSHLNPHPKQNLSFLTSPVEWTDSPQWLTGPPKEA